MKEYDYKNILTVLTEASPAHLALASFIVFPIVLKYWMQAILLFFPDLSVGWKAAAIIVLVCIYVVCLVWLAYDASRKRSLETKRDLILGRLSSNKWTAMGFDSAKQVLDESCKDEDIHKVIQAYPTVLRFVKLKVQGENGLLQDDHGNYTYKPGIALVQQENA